MELAGAIPNMEMVMRKMESPVEVVVDEVKKRRWVEMNVKMGMPRELVEVLAGEVRKVSGEEFDREARRVMQELSEKIEDQPCVIVTDEEEKSFWWMLNRYRDDLPRNFTLVSPDRLTDYAREHPEAKYFVNIDDASYTGKQEVGALGGIWEALRESASDKEILVAVVYATDAAVKEIGRAARGVETKIIKPARIESVADVLRRRFGERAGEYIAVLKERYREHLRWGEETFERTMLTSLPHKTPDSTSFLGPVRYGLVMNERGAVARNYLGMRMISAFVQEVTPSYHRPVEEVCPWLKEEDLKYVSKSWTS